MLDPWAFRNKHFKKQVYLRLVERATLAHASCLHALTRREAQCYREFGLKNPVAVIANGVDVPEAFSANEFLRRHEELRGRRLVLFLGRVHYKKGLDILSRAWAQVSRRFDDAHLVIAGPDFENTQAGVKATLDALNVGDRVTFTGMLPSALKWSALAAASVFILPSYSEGFSVAALEAMAAGLPVIVSEACNFPRVAEEDAGWVVTPTAEAVEDSLIQALSLRSCELAAYGRRGEQLVSRHYTWAGIGEQMRSLYEWLQGGAFPRNVEFA
jgi:glycosyltransferase involved in cell wall biosynthesis